MTEGDYGIVSLPGKVRAGPVETRREDMIEVGPSMAASFTSTDPVSSVDASTDASGKMERT